ncbi:MAG: M14 family metallopeptidase, partial [Bacteroidota bacterium]|nr:M14 family metallopeptidase [Bacteroidota bacterium]
MKKTFLVTYILLLAITLNSQTLLTPFEKTEGRQTTTYTDCIQYYEKLDRLFNSILIKKINTTDAGFPLHLILFSADNHFDIHNWQKDKVVILINNGIHAGEPDGIDASMMLARDLATGKVRAPQNVVIAFIAVYNIGGSLDRNSFSRVNQMGPESYGFRGNAQNLDLNRDFTKNDSRNARAFATIFHDLKPAIFIDNHVSDGADYQHTMTLLTTQQNKLGGPIATFLHNTLEPALYKTMEKKGWPMTPYVNFEDGSPEKGWTAFYDPPRYSSGYTSLFQTIGFVPETHMLKPFNERVLSTYALMQTIIEESSKHAKELVAATTASRKAVVQQTQFPLAWVVDSSRYDTIRFRGYAASYKTSDVTGQQRLFYDHSKPFEKEVRFYDYFKGENFVTAPKAYIIPQGWHDVIDLLKLNNVVMGRLPKDTFITVETYRVEAFKSGTKAYEKHHKNYHVVVSSKNGTMRFLKNDYVIYTNQPAKRYLVEMLEPTGDDSFFSWNFFDAILQQKEGYSNYRWEDVAATYLQQQPGLRQQLEEKKKSDTAFAASATAQLTFVYKNSPYYEPEHMRYP